MSQRADSARTVEEKPAPSPPLVSMRGVGKRYGATTALSEVDFSCHRGEIHAVLGEDGAGKSTLMKLLSGVVAPTTGEIFVEGQPVSLPTPSAAQKRGIVCMFQELSLSPDLTVGENILLGAPGAGWGFVPTSSLHKARSLLDQIGGEDIELSTLVAHLSLAEKQQVEIAKVLLRDPQLLILDEATSALNSHIVDKVFALIRGLRDEGTSILFISHRFHEVEAIADRVSVFRSGRHVRTFAAGTLSQREIINLMIGQPLEELFPPRQAERSGETVLEVKGLSAGDDFAAIDLIAQRGEIIGLGGLDGQGQTKFMQALFGLLDGVQGEIIIRGKTRSIRSPKRAKSRDFGLAFVPEDRKSEGLIPALSIRENMEMAALGRHPYGLLHLDSGIADSTYLDLIGELELVYSSLDAPIASLSGGNQQKVALIKWLALAPDCLLLLDPTRGIDVKTKGQIYRLLRRLSTAGMAVVLLSTDYDELVQLCDRVSIFYRGRITSVLEGETLTPERVVSASMGLVDHAA